MANVAHSTLTGSNLHENKGVASATDNTVGTASSGSTVWKKLDNTNLGPTANPFGSALFHIREEQATGVASSQTTVNNTWNTGILNTTKTNEISGASLSSNQISLPAGTYWAEGTFLNGGATSGVTTLSGKLRIRNITDSVDLITGPVAADGVNNNGSSHSLYLKGRFTIAGTKTLELQMWNGGTYRPPANATGTVEVYNELWLWKIA